MSLLLSAEYMRIYLFIFSFEQIGNIPKHISTDKLKEIFFRPRSGSTGNDTLDGNPLKLKGIHPRRHATDGIVILAFHDLRDANRAKTSIDTVGVADGSVRQDGILDDRDTDVGPSWETSLECDFITPRDLKEVCKNDKFTTTH
jgi:hypothetical protein